MKDLELELPDRPGVLARTAAALGQAGVSVEGGGVFVRDGQGIAHYLIGDDDAELALPTLRAVAVEVVAVHDVVLTRLRQDVPGQLGAFCAQLAAVDVNITTQYSDHDGQLVLVVDDVERAQQVADEWVRGTTT